MALTAKAIEGIFDKIHNDPIHDGKRGLLRALAEEARQATPGDREGRWWVKAFDTFIKLADSRHVADDIPGSTGKRFKDDYARRAAAGEDVTPGTLEDAHDLPGHVPPLDGTGVPTEGADPSPEPVATTTAEPREPTMVEKARDDLSAQKARDRAAAEAEAATHVPPSEDVHVQLNPKQTAVCVIVGAQFKDSRNVPFTIEGTGISVTADERPKAVKLFEHLQHTGNSINSEMEAETANETFSSVLAALR